MKYILKIVILIFLANNCIAQKYFSLNGIVIASGTNLPLAGVAIFVNDIKQEATTDSLGYFVLKITQNKFILGFKDRQNIDLNLDLYLTADTSIDFVMQSKTVLLDEVSIVAELQKNSHTILNDVENFSINSGRKTDIINIKEVAANKTINSSRQIYGRISGVNIIENDAAGIQLGIGTRGLNPNRITEFNARQNGYDIAADAFGYPESYYTPPTDFLQKIEIIRGAASLQYGPQFGGLLNFILLAPSEKKLSVSNKFTAGSFGFLSNNTIVSGTKKKLSFLLALNQKSAKGWRENSSYKNLNSLVIVNWKINSHFENSFQYTHMTYQMKQAGGLTDLQFAENAQQSFRQRNWFDAQWNILANDFTYKIDNNFKLNAKIFYMFSHRYSVGNLSAPNILDDQLDRDLQKDNYNNIGAEIRLIKSYKLFEKENTILAGFRIYNGKTKREQGFGDSLNDANFEFNNPESLEGSAFDFVSINYAFFTENIFRVTPNFSITPGVRIENLFTDAKGYYTVESKKELENKKNDRIFPLFGITVSNKVNTSLEFYGGIAQSYNAVNFNDIRVVNKNIVVDSNLKDVSGYNSELGARGNFRNLLFYDVNLFYLNYQDRIGLESKVDNQFNAYQFRTNIADSRSYGFETLVELDLLKLAAKKSDLGKLFFFQAFSFTNATYINTKDIFVLNNTVEYAPKTIYRSGLEYKHKNIKSSIQIAYTSSQYTDAGNSEASNTGINGIIPAYRVVDFTIEYSKKMWGLSFSCNNLLNQTYFTRRATGYPGPGILPSDPRSIFVGLEIKI